MKLRQTADFRRERGRRLSNDPNKLIAKVPRKNFLASLTGLRRLEP